LIRRSRLKTTSSYSEVLMRTVKIKKAGIKVPNSTAFQHTTPPEMPRCPCNVIAVARRGGGKSVAISNLTRMMEFDRVFLISPTAKSNYSILQPLGIDEEDIYEDLNDPQILNHVIDKVNAERDEYVEFLDAKKRHAKFSKMLDNGGRIPDELLEEFYHDEDFRAPKYKYGNRMPKMCLIVDDCQNSKVFSGKLFPSLVIKHRHTAQIPKEHGGGALGLSLMIMAQNYRSQGGGGLPKSVRNNATQVLLFKNYSDKEKAFVSEELAFTDDKQKFIDMWDSVCDSSPHAFLMVDLNKKPHHISPYRKNFDEFIMME